VIVNSFTLSISLGNQPGFVSFNSSISFTFDFKNPLAANRFLMKRKINKGPSVIVLKSLKLSFHGLTPFKISNGLMIIGRLKNSRNRETKMFMSRGQLII
jgi:hypothetical protein